MTKCTLNLKDQGYGKESSSKSEVRVTVRCQGQRLGSGSKVRIKAKICVKMESQGQRSGSGSEVWDRNRDSVRR